MLNPLPVMPWRQSEASKHVSCCEDESPNDNILEGVPGVFQLLLSDGGIDGGGTNR